MTTVGVRSSRGSTRERRPVGQTVFAYAVTAIILVPLLWIAALSFQPRQNILSSTIDWSAVTFDNYRSALESLPLLLWYGNTLIIAIPSVILGTVISFMLAFGLVKMVFRTAALQAALRVYVLIGLAVPVYIMLFPVYKIDNTLGIFGTYLALIIPYVAIAIPFNTLLFTGYLVDLPGEIEEAAIIDGVSLWRLITSVVMPLMRPVFATVLIFNTIYVLNEFPFASILLNDRSMYTVAMAASQFQGQYSTDYGAIMAATVMIIAPQVLVYFVFQKSVVAGMTVGAVKG